MIKILEWKLKVVKDKYSRVQLEYKRYSFAAISIIHVVELLEDNVIECRKRLFSKFEVEYKNLYKTKINLDFLDASSIF